MADNKRIQGKNVYSENDPLDINELASLDQEITDDFINQLQNEITKTIKSSDSSVPNGASESVSANNDGDLFEEVNNNEDENSKAQPGFNDEIDDNFIKKYKAKLKKHQDVSEEVVMPEHSIKEEEPEEDFSLPSRSVKTAEEEELSESPQETPPAENIETITGGNITEKPLSQETVDYNDSLDYLDGNVKYSKYVVYIDPENVDFVESLTVKERKNLINRILREQDSIAITKRKYSKIQAIIFHVIISILTITIAIPCIYWAINASLEATINNYRSSQTVFEQLYKENGKIKVK